MEKVKFSAIEQLLKMASVHMPKFEQMINDAGKELEELRKSAKNKLDDGKCEYCGNNCWKMVCETCGEESAG